MSKEKQKAAAAKPSEPKSKAVAPKPAAPPAENTVSTTPPPPLFRRIDWVSFGVTTLLVLIGYLLTISPNLTLEDSGELAVGSFYAGVPHPPGYPVWTIYTWIFTWLLPFSNIAWRVSVSSAVAGAFSCGIIALMVSRGCSLLLEGIEGLKDIERKWENALCMVAGFVAGALLGFNGFMWSQAVIVEVYTLSVLSLMGVLVCLMRWMYAPQQRKYLYWAAFWFGICFTNHQTLICAAMGIEVAVLARQPKLGRDLFAVNSIFYFLGLLLMAADKMKSIADNKMLLVIYNVIGVGSLIVCGWYAIKTSKLFSEWKPSLIIIGLGLLGASFYLYMPLASMTNPPMNWGYPRTLEGFIHAITRGQYGNAQPTSSLPQLIEQIDLLKDGAIEEFNLVYLAIGLVPFFFMRRMHPRDRAWMIGSAAIYVCLAFLLLILLSPTSDRQSRELTKVFFTASHVMISMWIGYGLAILGGLLLLHYEKVRYRALIAGAAACGVAFFVLMMVGSTDETISKPLSSPMLNALVNLAKLKVDPSHDSLIRGAALLGLIVPGIFTLMIILSRTAAAETRARLLMPVYLGLLVLIPTQSIVSHWSGNEQRGHMFGYWFGHDMFTPPFNGSDGKPLYPEMARDAILFGGTDPGRFCPTYMIFCESFIPASKKDDPKFDRRDVYIITQNALADAVYLNYIRAHYNRSTQVDSYFFSRLLSTLGPLSVFSGLAEAMLDKPFTALGKTIEDRRRKEGVYPPKEIHTPSPEESQRAYEEYVTDAARRKQHDLQFPNEPQQVRPGEIVTIEGGKVSVNGQTAVMGINGLLTKTIFERNPGHEFYVEESFPLDWMFPYLTPYGIILKINRQPVASISDDEIRRDHEFWSQYSDRLIGNWITYDTSVSNVCAFAERVYHRRDYTGFKGDRKFIRDDTAQKAFSKLRSAIGGVYTWRVNATVGKPEEQAKMIRESEFALKQAFAYCPYAGETVFRFANLLLALQRLDDALAVAKTYQKLDPYNTASQSLIDQIEQMKNRQTRPNVTAPTRLAEVEAQFRSQPTNLQLAIALFNGYLEVGQTNAAAAALDRLMAVSGDDATLLANVAHAFSRVSDFGRMENAMRRLVNLTPQNPEAWYDLAAIQSAGGKTQPAIASLRTAVQLSDARIKIQPQANNFRKMGPADARFVNLRSAQEFQALFASPPP